MKTSINGKPATWTDEIWRKWQAVIDSPDMPLGKVTDCNYFTPKPEKNEEGFVYTIEFRHVWIVTNLNT